MPSSERITFKVGQHAVWSQPGREPITVEVVAVYTLMGCDDWLVMRSDGSHVVAMAQHLSPVVAS